VLSIGLRPTPEEVRELLLSIGAEDRVIDLSEFEEVVMSFLKSSGGAAKLRESKPPTSAASGNSGGDLSYVGKQHCACDFAIVVRFRFLLANPICDRLTQTHRFTCRRLHPPFLIAGARAQGVEIGKAALAADVSFINERTRSRSASAASTPTEHSDEEETEELEKSVAGTSTRVLKMKVRSTFYGLRMCGSACVVSRCTLYTGRQRSIFCWESRLLLPLVRRWLVH
jgi:hypothetical protein